ncbi:MAG: YcjF family protein [Pseudomonadota bacterium]
MSDTNSIESTDAVGAVPPTQDASAGTVAVEAEDVARDYEVDGIVKNHVIASMAVGVVPVPIFDLVAVVGIQIRMMAKISELYDVPFSDDAARKIVISLIGGAVPVGVGASAASLLKSVPGLGSMTGAAGVILVGGATTYATGRLYAEHLASGGTVATLKGPAVKARFKELLAQGKTFAKSLRKNEKDASEPAPAPAADTTPA